MAVRGREEVPTVGRGEVPGLVERERAEAADVGIAVARADRQHLAREPPGRTHERGALAHAVPGQLEPAVDHEAAPSWWRGRRPPRRVTTS